MINIIRLSTHTILSCYGEDAKTFLQGQLTCNLNEIKEQSSRLGLHCNPKGRAVASFCIFLLHDRYYFCLPDTMLNTLKAALAKYAVFSKVTLENASDFSCVGIISDTPSDRIPTLPDSCAMSAYPPHHQENKRYLLIGPKSVLEAWIADYPTISDSTPWEQLNIQEGIASLTPQTSEQFTPHALGYHNIAGVSLTKGCYTGQEIVSRMHHLGQSKQTLVSLRADHSTTLSPGAQLYHQDKPIGTVINLAHTLHHDLILAVIPASLKDETLYTENKVNLHPYTTTTTL